MKAFWEIYVADLRAAERFYTEIVGLQVTRRMVDFLVLQTGSAKIHICSETFAPEHLKDAESTQQLGAKVEFCFEVEDIVEAYAKVQAAGYPISEPIKEQDWGKTDFRVLDPDGAYIRITSPRIRANKYAHLEMQS